MGDIAGTLVTWGGLLWEATLRWFEQIQTIQGTIAVLGLLVVFFNRRLARLLEDAMSPDYIHSTIPAKLAFIALAVWFGWVLMMSVHDRVTARSTEAPAEIQTSVRMQFFGDTRIPTEIHSANVKHWFVMWHPSAAISWIAPDTGAMVKGAEIPRTWTIFVLFERPVKVSEAVISFAGTGFPMHEVKNVSERHVIAHVSGDIPAGALEIYIKH
jgi:hypothetical protein